MATNHSLEIPDFEEFLSDTQLPLSAKEIEKEAKEFEKSNPELVASMKQALKKLEEIPKSTRSSKFQKPCKARILPN